MSEQLNLYEDNNKKPPVLKIVIIAVIVILAAAVIFLGIKLFSKNDVGSNDNEPNSTSTLTSSAEQTPEPTPFKAVNEEGMTIESRFNPPEGYKRVDVAPGSFADYIRKYELKEYGVLPLSKNTDGAYIEPDTTYKSGVFNAPNELNKWMQCSDSILMLYAEYLYSNGKYEDIKFTFANGFVCDWLTYAAGNRFNLKSNKWENTAEPDSSYETFQKYLDLCFQYCNTDSLQVDMSANITVADFTVGDAFVVGVAKLAEAAKEAGSPYPVKYGHAILIVDVAINEQTGEKVFMLAEGNTPATEITIAENPDTGMGVWFKLDEKGAFIKSDITNIKWSAAWLKRFPKQ